MNILFISGAYSADYQCDSVFHGLRSLYGPTVIDPFRMAHMYQGADLSNMYGRGFTLFGLIEEGAVDRSDIESKIKNKFFDLCIFGSCRRPQTREYLGKVWDAYGYDHSRIVFIDGEDDPEVWMDLAPRGSLFKRELHKHFPGVYPIQFGFPAEKIQSMMPKTRVMAPLDPIDTRTYIYQTEQEYYDSYRTSLFGRTHKKAGWECMRHLEIMACRSIPYFVGLESCPDSIMTRSPKAELLLAKSILEYRQGEMYLSSAGERIWETIEQKIFAHFQTHLTTTALVKYIFDTIPQRKEAPIYA